jgi:hypothetical protein
MQMLASIIRCLYSILDATIFVKFETEYMLAVKPPGFHMKVAIIGSWRDGDREWGLRGSHSDFEQACLAIGREFGRHRQRVVVGGQSLSTADLHVVRGVIDVARHQQFDKPLIEVLRPAGDSSSYEDLARQFPGLFEFHAPSQARWAEAHLLSLREADVVVAIAGMKGTYQAGLAAIVAQKTLVPVSSFGGAAAKLSSALESISAGFGDASVGKG